MRMCVLISIISLLSLAHLSIAQNKLDYDPYGGVKALKNEATGFFHLKKFSNRYFFVTPDGNGYRALGINHFHNMSSKDYDGAIKNIKDWGFNAGCYQGPRWMWKRYPYTQAFNLLHIAIYTPDVMFKFRDVFDSDYLEELDTRIRHRILPQVNNKNLIGYFWTDLPVWTWPHKRNKSWVGFYKKLPKDSPGGKVWAQWKKQNPNSPENDFLPVIAKQLYAKAYEFFRKYDKNHLIFGERYNTKDMPAAVVKEALPYIDAIAIQPMGNSYDKSLLEKIYKDFGKPIYIADHVSSFATDQHPVTMGQAAKNPESYVKYYEHYLTSALSLPYVIGFNKCQYQDIPSPKMLKQGLIKIDESPYSTVEGVKKANKKALLNAYKEALK